MSRAKSHASLVGNLTPAFAGEDVAGGRGKGLPSSQGRLLFPDQVAELVFHGRKSSWWIRRHVAPTKKLRLGHSTVAWFEADIWTWLAEQRVSA
jgi:predicted DNA-binding transcriptional regulator AlpA